MRTYVDADVLIWHLRGDPKALTFLRGLSAEVRDDLWIGPLQRAEVVFFMRRGEEKLTMLLLNRFKTDTLDARTVDEAAVLYRKWNPSHGIDVNDSLLAAAAIRHQGRIACLNVKHYPMPEARAWRAWPAG